MSLCWRCCLTHVCVLLATIPQPHPFPPLPTHTQHPALRPPKHPSIHQHTLGCPHSLQFHANVYSHTHTRACSSHPASQPNPHTRREVVPETCLCVCCTQCTLLQPEPRLVSAEARHATSTVSQSGARQSPNILQARTAYQIVDPQNEEVNGHGTRKRDAASQHNTSSDSSTTSAETPPHQRGGQCGHAPWAQDVAKGSACLSNCSSFEGGQVISKRKRSSAIGCVWFRHDRNQSRT